MSLKKDAKLKAWALKKLKAHFSDRPKWYRRLGVKIASDATVANATDMTVVVCVPNSPVGFKLSDILILEKSLNAEVTTIEADCGAYEEIFGKETWLELTFVGVEPEGWE